MSLLIVEVKMICPLCSIAYRPHFFETLDQQYQVWSDVALFCLLR